MPSFLVSFSILFINPYLIFKFLNFNMLVCLVIICSLIQYDEYCVTVLLVQSFYEKIGVNL